MSAQTYEWDIETTLSGRGNLVVGPWQDEFAEPVVVIDRRELMARRPGVIAVSYTHLTLPTICSV